RGAPPPEDPPTSKAAHSGGSAPRGPPNVKSSTLGGPRPRRAPKVKSLDSLVPVEEPVSRPWNPRRVSPTSLVVHAHFYQPPRENPWTEEVPREPSAAPFHDWNARISAESYRPNAYARIFDGNGRVLA